MTSGSVTITNGTVITLSSGSFPLSRGGVLTSSFSLSVGGSNLGIGTMASTKDQIWGADLGRDAAS